MGLFTRKSNELTDVYQRIMQIQTEIAKLTAAIGILETNMASLRGVMNRKLGKAGLKEEIEQEEPVSLQDLQRALLGISNGKE